MIQASTTDRPTTKSEAAQRKRKPPAPTTRAVTPAAFADVALVDGPTCAAAACVAISQWHSWVAAGIAPKPVIKQARFTRWRFADMRAFLDRLATAGTVGGEA